MSILIIFLLTLVAQESLGNGRPPDYEVKIRAVYPKGLSVVIEDDGYSALLFHTNLNGRVENNFPGVAMAWTNSTRGKGLWYLYEQRAPTTIGDKIHYVTYVVKDGFGFRQDEQEYTVTEYVNETDLPEETIYKESHGPLLQIKDLQKPGFPKPCEAVQTKVPCEPSITQVLGRNSVCKEEVLLNEEFDDEVAFGKEEFANWDAEKKFVAEPDYCFNVYMGYYSLYFKKGILEISPKILEDENGKGSHQGEIDMSTMCTGQTDRECKRTATGAQIIPPVVTGKITTKNKFAFKYGRIEVRAKLPVGDWLIPEINLEPLNNVYGSGHYQSGLIRIAFLRGNRMFSKKLYGGPVLSDIEPYRSYLMEEMNGIEDWNKDFHNYTVIWTPESITLKVDGRQYGMISPDTGESFYSSTWVKAVPHVSNWLNKDDKRLAPLNQMFYVSLGLRVGGIHDFSDDILGKPWKNRSTKAMLQFYDDKDTWIKTWTDPDLKVDYVRVYAL